MKKVLVITYHWPPSGGISVLRCLKLVKYLREFGWEPIVFTAKDASYQFLDFNNESDIPTNLEIHQVPIFEPINLFKKLTGRSKNKPVQNITNNSEKKRRLLDDFSIWLRGNFFIPDARAAWIKPSVNYLRNYLSEHKVDAIFTDGPPHTNTVIGMKLAQEFNIPWLADFQDPWTQVDYYSQMKIGKRADNKHRKLEQEVFRTADKITIASPSWKVDLEQIGAKNVDVFYYGYDEQDFSTYTPIHTKDNFVIFHGGLLGNDRNPEHLFEALRELVDEHPEFESKLSIQLAGEVDIQVRQKIADVGLTKFVTFLGMIPRKDVISLYASSQLLLLPINKAENAKGRIPGKLFELLRTEKPILVLGPSDSDVKAIVEDAKRGKQFEYTNKTDIKLFVLDCFNQTFQLEIDNSTILQYTNYKQSQQIALLLNEISN